MAVGIQRSPLALRAPGGTGFAAQVSGARSLALWRGEVLPGRRRPGKTNAELGGCRAEAATSAAPCQSLAGAAGVGRKEGEAIRLGAYKASEEVDLHPLAMGLTRPILR